MKCQLCDGKGEYMHQCGGYRSCEHCNGTGKVDITNEEWFCQLPTYKKAILMANCYDAFKLDQYACNKHVVIEEWLKEIHDGE